MTQSGKTVDHRSPVLSVPRRPTRPYCKHCGKVLPLTRGRCASCHQGYLVATGRALPTDPRYR
jgi:hypothetical protein